MSNQTRDSHSRRMTIAVTASVLLGLGAFAPAVQAADDAAQPGSQAPLILAATKGMERRQDRREDRRDDRQERREGDKD